MSGEAEEDDKGVRLTPAQWAEVVTLWELGEVTLEHLSERFGISVSAVYKGLRKRGATKGSRAHEVAAKVKAGVLKAAEESGVSAEEERQNRIKETRQQHYDWAKMLSQQIVGSLAKAQKEMREFASESANVKTLRFALSALEIARKERFAVLNADDDLGEGELPTLPLEDLSPADILELQKSDDNDDLILASADDDVVTEA